MSNTNKSSIRTGIPAFSSQSLRSGDALSELVHKIGHDIGNPLTAIISVCSIMQTMAAMDKKASNTALVSKVSEYADMLTGEAWKISRINERLVSLLSSRKPNFVSCNIHGNFITVFNRLQSRNPKKFGKLEIVFNSVSNAKEAEQCSNITALADNNQLNLLITELVTNCADALEKDAVSSSKTDEVRKVLVNIFKDSDQACLSVASTVGFRCETDNLNELFNPFVTVGYPEEKKIGLGLTTALATVERMQGKIELQEQENNGKFCFTVTVRLPIGK